MNMEINIVITKATTDDIPELEKLINSAYRGEESKKGWTTEAYLLEGKRINQEGLKEIINADEAVILKCTNDHNNIIGSVYLKKNGNKMYLGMLTVSPMLQAAGIGKKILKASEEYAKDRQCDVIEMRVISVRNELIEWYGRNGYKHTGRQEPFPDDQLSVQKQPIEFIVMEKSL